MAALVVKKAIEKVYNPARIFSPVDVIAATTAELQQNVIRLQDSSTIFKADSKDENAWFHNVILSTTITDSLISTGFIFNFEIGTQVQLAQINEISKEINDLIRRGTAAVAVAEMDEDVTTMFSITVKNHQKTLLELMIQAIQSLKPVS